MRRDAILVCVVVPCVLAAAATPAAAADAPLERMFFTPAQRAQLDVARTQRARSTLATERTEEVLTAAPAPQALTYDGLVRRSDGKSTVFLNNRPVHDKEPVGGVIVGRVRADGGVSLQMPQTGRTIDLRPGQSVELLSGQIEEAYGRKPAAAPETKPEAKPSAKPAPTADRARDERDRDEKEQQRVDEAVARALKEKSGARPDTAPTPAESPR